MTSNCMIKWAQDLAIS